jgi:hypothetical protein
MRPPILIAWAILIFVAGWQFGRPGQQKITSSDSDPQAISSADSSKREPREDLSVQLENAQTTIEQQREVIDQLRAQIEQRALPETVDNGAADPAADPEANAVGNESDGSIISTATPSPSSTHVTHKDTSSQAAHNNNLKAILKVEANTPEQERLQEYKRFLKKVAVNDFTSFESILTRMDRSSPEFENSIGRFRGNLQFLKGDRQPGRVSLLLQQPSAKPYRAAVRVDVVDGLRDKTTHFGGIDLLKRLPGKSSAVFIQSSDRSYLQLYFMTELATWVGNFYEKDDSGFYDRVAIVKLERQSSP